MLSALPVKVLLASASLLPAYGGPAYSVSRLATALSGRGADVALWAADGSATVIAAGVGVRLLAGSAMQALTDFGRPDVLHDSGLWLPHNHRLAALAMEYGIPRMVSTRGMLEPWAMRHKRLKKHIAWLLYQRRDLQRARLVHATSPQEERNLRRYGLSVPSCVIPNGVDLPAARPDGSTSTPRTALFLGRLYPVKGLPNLIDAWANACPSGWRLVIAGPDEGGHRAALEALVANAGLRDVVSFPGALTGEAKRAAFDAADLFVLPSHSESFGMAVAEALAHGVPVLTTTATPWPELATCGCGWSVAPTAEGLAGGLRAATALAPETLAAMGAQGRAWMAADFAWPAIADRFLAVYETLAREP